MRRARSPPAASRSSWRRRNRRCAGRWKRSWPGRSEGPLDGFAVDSGHRRRRGSGRQSRATGDAPRAGPEPRPYVVVSTLGRGGMGEVYRARHEARSRRGSRFCRRCSDPTRIACVRFQREARTLAALNHPNIAAIYGLEERDGATALVLELVEDRRWPTASLRVRSLSTRRCGSRRKSLTPSKRLTSAASSTDLKPANVKLGATAR